jgi:hypothetical protein
LVKSSAVTSEHKLGTPRDRAELALRYREQADGTVSEGVSQIRKVAAMAELFGRRFVPHYGSVALVSRRSCTRPAVFWGRPGSR